MTHNPYQIGAELARESVGSVTDFFRLPCPFAIKLPPTEAELFLNADMFLYESTNVNEPKKKYARM